MKRKHPFTPTCNCQRCKAVKRLCTPKPTSHLMDIGKLWQEQIKGYKWRE